MSPITKRFCLFITAMLLFSSAVFASSTFIVRHIKVNGLQRVSRDSVVAAMPIHVGQTYHADSGVKIISDIYATGFFSRVRLAKEGNTLIVSVVERPTIGLIRISGNETIKSKQLKPVLKKMGIVIGNTYDPSQLHAIVLGLQQQYAALGHAGAAVTPSVQHLSRNRVAIQIKIKEGAAQIVRSIKISGNRRFSESELLKQFKLTTPGLFSWFTHDDQFSKMKLAADLEKLKNFYFNHGYLQFRIVSKRVKTLTNGRGVAITIQVFEGDQYRVSGYRITGHLSPDVNKAIHHILAGLIIHEPFSREKVVGLTKQIGDELSNHGYAFPMVTPIPQLNTKKHTVFLNFHIEQGRHVYVREVHIAGNHITNGLAIRTQLRQFEGSVYSGKNIRESKRRIANLGYLNNIQVAVKKVPGKTNQVDLNYHVHEVSAGRASVQAGYSDVDGFLYGASISEPNFMGSGRFVSLGFQRSEFSSSYNFSYTNPFYTISGISRGVSVFYNHTTPGKVNLDPYTMDSYGASVTYGIPVSEYSQFSLGGGYSHIAISNVNPGVVSPTVQLFLRRKPSPFNQFKAVANVSRATLDRAIFPTSGSAQSLALTLGVPVLKSSLAYYQLVYDARYYYPLGHGFVINTHLTLGYGDGYSDTPGLPFFNNFYAGGLRTLPGYEANTLGPKNPHNLSQALGGNVEILGGLNFILPNFISDKVRTAIILDAGNIFQTHQPATTPPVNYESVSLKNLRVTAGIMVSWWSPLGAPLDFSLAVPLNKKPGDQLALFGFSFGATM